jgi:hypothetical protein
LVVGNDEQLSGRIHCSNTDGKDGKSRNTVDGIVDSPLKITIQSAGTSRFAIFGTGNSRNGNGFTIRFTFGITDRLRGGLGILGAFLVVVTISQDDQDLLVSSTDGSSGSFSGHHVRSIYDTGRDRGTRTAARS